MIWLFALFAWLPCNASSESDIFKIYRHVIPPVPKRSPDDDKRRKIAKRQKKEGVREQKCFWRWNWIHHFEFQEIFASEILRRALRKIKCVCSFNWVMRSPTMWGYLDWGLTPLSLSLSFYVHTDFRVNYTLCSSYDSTEKKNGETNKQAHNKFAQYSVCNFLFYIFQRFSKTQQPSELYEKNNIKSSRWPPVCEWMVVVSSFENVHESTDVNTSKKRSECRERAKKKTWWNWLHGFACVSEIFPLLVSNGLFGFACLLLGWCHLKLFLLLISYYVSCDIHEWFLLSSMERMETDWTDVNEPFAARRVAASGAG